MHLSKNQIQDPVITALLPLFQDYAHTLAMTKHGMHLIKATNHVNPGQVPVMTVNQPLLATATKMAWT